jgi:hypothetical protein
MYAGLIFTCCLTFEFTRLRRLAKPAVAGRVQRKVRPHCGTSVTGGTTGTENCIRLTRAFSSEC